MIVLLVSAVSLLVGAVAFILTDGGWPEVSPLIAILSAIATALACHIWMPALERRFGRKGAGAGVTPPAAPVFVPAVNIPSQSAPSALMASEDDTLAEVPAGWTGVENLEAGGSLAAVEEAGTTAQDESPVEAAEFSLPSWPPEPQPVQAPATEPSAGMQPPAALPAVIPGAAPSARKSTQRRAGDASQLPLNLDTGL